MFRVFLKGLALVDAPVLFPIFALYLLPCGLWISKDMGQQMGYRGLEWNWPKEAMNIPIWAGVVDGAKLF